MYASAQPLKVFALVAASFASSCRATVLDRVDRRRRRRAFEQLAALRRVFPCVGETDRVERAQTHLTGSAIEAVSEDPAAPSAVWRDLQPEPAAVAVQARPQSLQIQRRQLVRFPLRLLCLLGHVGLLPSTLVPTINKPMVVNVNG
jgi:hypothetical protein